MREGMESLSLIRFLQVSEGCLHFVFPLQNEVRVGREDFLSSIDSQWMQTLVGDQKTTMNWFLQYVADVDNGNAGMFRHSILERTRTLGRGYSHT